MNRVPHSGQVFSARAVPRCCPLAGAGLLERLDAFYGLHGEDGDHLRERTTVAGSSRPAALYGTPGEAATADRPARPRAILRSWTISPG
jgi:hypothetical protein